jgi:hypothetical protein
MGQVDNKYFCNRFIDQLYQVSPIEGVLQLQLHSEPPKGDGLGHEVGNRVVVRLDQSLKNTDKIILGPVSNDAAKPAVSVWVDGLLLEVLFFALLRAGDVITLEPGCFRIGIETCAHI